MPKIKNKVPALKADPRPFQACLVLPADRWQAGGRGFTLIEIIAYVAVLALVSTIAVNTLLLIRASLAQIRVTRSMNGASSVAMEHMTRITRNAKTVDVSGSSFDVSPGILTVTDNASPPISHRFSVNANTLKYQRNAQPSVDLTPSGVLVKNLTFRLITAAGISQAVKIELTLEAYSGKSTTTNNLYNTIVLRNSYAQ